MDVKRQEEFREFREEFEQDFTLLMIIVIIVAIYFGYKCYKVLQNRKIMTQRHHQQQNFVFSGEWYGL